MNVAETPLPHAKARTAESVPGFFVDVADPMSLAFGGQCDTRIYGRAWP